MVQTTLRIPKQLHRLLKERAKAKGMTLNGLIIAWLWRSVE